MAVFQGSMSEFHRFLGPKIRNSVNVFTRKARKARNGICEKCGKKETLESAHVHGRERKVIIEEVLVKYLEHQELNIPDLGRVEQDILLSHNPIEENFLFLCRECHKDYDNANNGEDISFVVDSDRYNQNTESNSIVNDFVEISGVKIPSKKENYRCVDYFRDVLPKLLPLLNPSELSKLQDATFCKEKLLMRYPVITQDEELVFDSKRNRRFYAHKVLGKYFVCNDWYTKNFQLWNTYLVELSCR